MEENLHEKTNHSIFCVADSLSVSGEGGVAWRGRREVGIVAPCIVLQEAALTALCPLTSNF